MEIGGRKRKIKSPISNFQFPILAFIVTNSSTAVVGLIYLLYFFPAICYARLHLPYSGFLGSRFSTFPVRGSFPSFLRYYVQLRLPVYPSRFTSPFELSFPNTLCHSLYSCPVSSSSTDGSYCQRQMFVKPVTPYPVSHTRRQVALSSSRATPMNTCPAHRPRWCPVSSPIRFQNCCLPPK